MDTPQECRVRYRAPPDNKRIHLSGSVEETATNQRPTLHLKLDAKPKLPGLNKRTDNIYRKYIAPPAGEHIADELAGRGKGKD